MVVIGVAGSALSLVMPYYGLLLLGVLYFFRPDLWGATYIRPVLWLTVAVALGWLINRKTTGVLEGSRWLIVMVLLYVVSTLFGRFTSQESWAFLIHMLKIFVVVFLIVKLCDTPARLAGFVAAILVGCLWFIKVSVLSWAAVGFSGSVRIDTGVGQGGGSNYIAWVLASTLPFLLYKAAYGKGREKPLAICLIVPWLVAIIATGSRGGLLCLVAGVAVLLALIRRFRLVLVGGVLLVAFLWLAPKEYTERVATLTLDPAKMDPAALARYQNMQAGFKIIKDYPLFGTGLGTFPTVKLGYITPDYVGQEYHVVHNTFIQMGCELGLPVLAFFLGINVYVAWHLVRRAGAKQKVDRSSHLEWIRAGVLGALASSAVVMIKGDVAHMDYLWWLYAVAFACQRLRAPAPAPALEKLPRRSGVARLRRALGAP